MQQQTTTEETCTSGTLSEETEQEITVADRW